MATSSILLLCLLVTCSVWTVQSRDVKVSTDEGHDDQVELSVEPGELPGVCRACKWALNKVKKIIGEKSTDEVKLVLRSICEEIWSDKVKTLAHLLCKKFVNNHPGRFIEKLANTDVRTICVQIKACKEKKLEELFHSGFVPEMDELNECA